MIAVAVLWMLTLVIVFGGAGLLPPAGRSCPRCCSETLALRSALLRPFGGWLSRRWCLRCGWSGVVRIGRFHRAGARSGAARVRGGHPS